jgi:coiled-coil domain-containing protein 55
MSLRTVAPQQKYGLVKKKTAVPLKAGITSVFGGGDDDDDDDDDGDNKGRSTNGTGTGRSGGNSAVGRVNRTLLQKSAVAEKEQQKLYDEALGQDPDVFDYDGVYDSMKASQMASHALSQTTEAPKARYVYNLKATATVRDKEKERIFERKLLKERKQDDEEFGDKEKFVTAAYKQKLMESQKWEYEDKYVLLPAWTVFVCVFHATLCHVILPFRLFFTSLDVQAR